MGDGGASTTMSAPVDRYNLIYIIFYWLGMGSLLPWNFFISVNGYWKHKFRNVSADHPAVGHGDDVVADADGHFVLLNHTGEGKGDDPEKLSHLQLEWNSYLSIASMIPNVTFLLLNAAFGHKFPTMPRLMVSQVVIIVCLIVTDAFAATDTDAWQDTFFLATIVTVVVINIMVAVFQGGLSGVAAKFPHRYMGAVVQGQGLGGIFAASVNVLTLAVPGIGYQSAAFYCFLVTIVFLALALVCLVALMRTEFFMYYYESRHAMPSGQQKHHQSTDSAATAATNATNGGGNPEDARLIQEDAEADKSAAAAVTMPPAAAERINVFRIGARVWVWVVAVFVNFLVTLAVFPAITALVVSVDHGHGDAWADRYFNPVGCFLLFNVGDYAGRILASWLKYPRATRWGAWAVVAASTLRLAFLPLFLLCNASPANRVHTHVAFHSDAAYLVLMVLFSTSSGYIGTICMMFAPKMLPEGESQATAASIMVSFLVLGLAVGSVLSHASVQLL